MKVVYASKSFVAVVAWVLTILPFIAAGVVVARSGGILRTKDFALLGACLLVLLLVVLFFRAVGNNLVDRREDLLDRLYELYAEDAGLKVVPESDYDARDSAVAKFVRARWRDMSTRFDRITFYCAQPLSLETLDRIDKRLNKGRSVKIFALVPDREHLTFDDFSFVRLPRKGNERSAILKTQGHYLKARNVFDGILEGIPGEHHVVSVKGKSSTLTEIVVESSQNVIDDRSAFVLEEACQKSLEPKVKGNESSDQGSDDKTGESQEDVKTSLRWASRLESQNRIFYLTKDPDMRKNPKMIETLVKAGTAALTVSGSYAEVNHVKIFSVSEDGAPKDIDIVLRNCEDLKRDFNLLTSTAQGLLNVVQAIIPGTWEIVDNIQKNAISLCRG